MLLLVRYTWSVIFGRDADNGLVVRSADKLKKMLAAKGVTENVISAHLTIIEGNIKDIASVRKALVDPKDSTKLSGLIISGVGGTPKGAEGWNLKEPVTLDDPHICETATRNILEASQQLQSEGLTGKPMVTVVSTTGVTSGKRDVPVAFLPLYHWLLAVPHQDKRQMEKLLEEAVVVDGARVIGSFVFVRPSLLTDGAGRGLTKVKHGWEGGEAEDHGPAIGWTTTRDDVGAWMFEHLVRIEERAQWANRKVTITNGT